MAAHSPVQPGSLPVFGSQPENVEREKRLQRLLIAFIVAGLLFLLLPGTFLGVWNLVSISSSRAVDALSPAWVQAHGHAQIFGWIGTFILGIGFYSLSKMGRLPAFAISRGWTCFVLWTSGAALRWIAGVTEWRWRILLPLSTLLCLAGFLTFFATVNRHRPKTDQSHRKPETWMLLVIASTFGFLIALVANAGAAMRIAWDGGGPAFPHVFDQQLVALETWCFPVVAIWGFNARWLPTFLGLDVPRPRLLLSALVLTWASVATGFGGFAILSALLLPVAAVAALIALRVWTKPLRPPKIEGVHRSFPWFIRISYAWLLAASGLWVWAALGDHSGGIWGAARHALTVGFISTMVFAIGQRILPAFGGARVLYSPRLMFGSLLALTVGCALRVGSEIPAYEGYSKAAWHLLPCSAVIELLAVGLFATNLLVTFSLPPAHIPAHNGGRLR
ncbi:MAG TPA: NnrS family protein [Bryobacteraceae bacterium]|jgi:hypothetical protein